jgi:hypothetical protein
VALEPVFRGSRATVAVENALANSAAFLMWDTDAVPQGFSYAGLQFYLGFYNFSAFYVGQTQSSTSVYGYASQPIQVPGIPSLAGARIYTQWLIMDPAGPIGATTSGATEIVVR